MIARQNCQILDLVVTCTAAICTIVADEGAVAEKEEIGIGVEEGAAGVTPEAVQMPSVSSYRSLAVHSIFNDPVVQI